MSEKPDGTANRRGISRRILATIGTVVGIIVGSIAIWQYLSSVIPETNNITILDPTELEVFDYPGVVRGDFERAKPNYRLYVFIHAADCKPPGQCEYFAFDAVPGSDEKTWTATEVTAGNCNSTNNQELTAIITDKEYPKDENGNRYRTFDISWNVTAKVSDTVVIQRVPSCT